MISPGNESNGALLKTGSIARMKMVAERITAGARRKTGLTVGCRQNLFCKA